MDYGEFRTAVADRASVPPDRAEALARATLETLAERISGGEGEDIAAQLPEPLQESLRRPRDKAAERFGLDDFVRRVSERAGVDAALATDGARAVLTTIRQSVTGEEFGDLMAQLPNEFGQVVAPTHWRG